MNLKDLMKNLRKHRQPKDTSPEAAIEWHKYQDVVQFLMASQKNEVPMLVQEGLGEGGSLVMNSYIVPSARLDENHVDDLLGWNFPVIGENGYGSGHSTKNGISEPEIFEPMLSVGSHILEGSDPVFFVRRFNGFSTENYYELNQKVEHVSVIHWVPEKKAWCTLNDQGDVVPLARILIEDDITCCTFDRELLDRYLYFADACLVRVFYIQRGTGWEMTHKAEKDAQLVHAKSDDIHARRMIYSLGGTPNASILRGVQIIRCSLNKDEMHDKLENRVPREYASFIIHDFKHGLIKEWSSAPSQLDNYFKDSGLPLETSPAFFRPDLLAHYKQDPSRFTIERAFIRCRGGWSIPYSVNDERQVTAYICDLSALPYQEQVRWKSFNEEPKAPLSEAAYKKDFLASWEFDYDPLISLQDILATFPLSDSTGNPAPLWQMPKVSETRTASFLNYVLTESRKEWEDQILALAQIVIDGLNTKHINSVAEERGCRDTKLASSKQMMKVLETAGIPEDERAAISDPLAELWKLRSGGIAHPGSGLQGQDLREHYTGLLELCDVALRKLAFYVEAGIFTI